ncbi:MAG: formylglycine-generating enzyme family protein [Anaerolineae bacterium]
MTPDTLPELDSIIWPDDGKEMIFIPGGTFTMGSDDDAENARPAHPVTVGSFYIDRWPVTNAEYKVFVDKTGYPVPNYDVPWCDTTGYNWDVETKTYPPGKDDHPVVLVTFEDVKAYAAWAGKRLPTEAEWEFAARGVAGRLWPWGNQFKPNCSNTAETHRRSTTPVGLFSSQGDTPEGVVDMVGNVWEWVSSLYLPYPYRADDGREDAASGRWRVLRGGSWVNDSTVANAIARLDGDFLFYNNVGFRCAVTAG